MHKLLITLGDPAGIGPEVIVKCLDRVSHTPDVEPVVVGEREILEETGYSFNKWRLVQVRQPYRKIEWFVYVLLAWDMAGQQEPHLDAGEKIGVQPLDFDELKTQIMQDDGASAQSYLGESRDIFGQINSLDDLLALPEFEGREVDR